jgi:hypothetical protein
MSLTTATVVRVLPTAAAVVVCTALMGWVQFSFDGMHDGDSYFHTRAARELDQHGVRDGFPQTAFSTWSERYSDKDLLFHVFLIPIQRLHDAFSDRDHEDLATPGKHAAVVLTLVFFACFGAALHAIDARFPWLWLLLLFVADAPLLLAFLPVRPGLLAISFVVVEIALILRRKSLWLFLVGALHTLAHSSFILLPALAGAWGVAHLLRRERPAVRLLAVAILGPILGLVLNPYFPDNLFVAWDQLVEVARAVWLGASDVPAQLFGTELVGPRTSQFLGSYPAFLPAVGGLVAFLAWPSRRLTTEGLALVLMTGLLLGTGFLSERFLRFFFPAVVLLGARLWSEILENGPLREAWRRDATALATFAGILGVSLVGGLSDGSVLTVKQRVSTLSTTEIYRPAVEFLKREARPDELVYHNFWWDFSALYHYRPEGRYVVALDPVFFQRFDPNLFDKALEAFAGRSENIHRVLREDFGARWVFVPKDARYFPFFNLLRQDGRFEKAYEDAHVVIVRLP